MGVNFHVLKFFVWQWAEIQKNEAPIRMFYVQINNA